MPQLRNQFLALYFQTDTNLHREKQICHGRVSVADSSMLLSIRPRNVEIQIRIYAVLAHLIFVKFNYNDFYIIKQT